ncbi:hypothetical protein [uncultured Helicobacter sp.]|uniref:hypothetical protein n=1 Tax=uncultured Helicobacter sp. TaxID=175537 RepID=UPI002608DEDB|nr:hypothetical protein [uncultured Helicobacter sp.]
MEKLQLKKVHPTGRGQHVRLDNALIREVAVLSGETGYSMKKLMDKLVRFALDNVEVIDEEEGYND